jgi:hypothetical protein
MYVHSVSKPLAAAFARLWQIQARTIIRTIVDSSLQKLEQELQSGQNLAIILSLMIKPIFSTERAHTSRLPSIVVSISRLNTGYARRILDLHFSLSSTNSGIETTIKTKLMKLVILLIISSEIRFE